MDGGFGAGLDADPSGDIFARLAEMVYSDDDVDAVFDVVVNAAPQLIAGCDHASLMLAMDGGPVTVASSDPVAAMVDAFGCEVGEGPCLDAITSDAIYSDSDLQSGSPWPRLAQRVLAKTPVRAMVGFRLRAGEGRTGSLNLFSDTPGSLTGRSLSQGTMFASFITVAMLASYQRQTADTLRSGLQSNREIGKAIGLMMAFHKISDDEAFKMLRSASQDMNLKLHDVARQVVEHHNRG